MQVEVPPCSMVYANGDLWCASEWFISIYDVETLALKRSWMASAVEDRKIAEMRLSCDGNMVWCRVSDHWLLNAWNARTLDKSCTIDITHALESQVRGNLSTAASLIAVTAMETCLDTIWLGLSSGEILVYDEQGECYRIPHTLDCL